MSYFVSVRTTVEHKPLSLFYFLTLLNLVVQPGMTQPYYPVKVDNQWGLIDRQGHLALQPRYDLIGTFDQFGYATLQLDGKVGLLNKKGEELLRPAYEDIQILDSLLIGVRIPEGWKIMDLQRKDFLPFTADQIHFWDGRAIGFERNNKWGLARPDGSLLAGPTYDYIDQTEEDFYIAVTGDLQGLLFLDGTPALPPAYEEIGALTADCFLVKQKGNWGVLSKNGQIQAPIRFPHYSFLNEHYIKLFAYEEIHLFSLACGKIIAREKNKEFYPFSTSYVLVKSDRKIGLIDQCGATILPVQYDEVLWYTPELFRVNLGQKWALVEAGNIPKTPYKYDYIAPLQDQVGLAKAAGHFGLLNRDGEEVVEPRYRRIELEAGLAKAYYSKEQNGKQDALVMLQFDENGRLLSNERFDQHFRIRVGKTAGQNSIQDQNLEAVYIMQDFEWYYDSEDDRWGLRQLATGSIQIDPAFAEIQVKPDLGLTLVSLGSANDYEYQRTSVRFNEVFGIVNNDLGLLVTELRFLHIFLEDFYRGGKLARCILENGSYGLIDRKGKLITGGFTYLGSFQNGLAVAAQGGRISATLESSFGLHRLKVYLEQHLSSFSLLDNTNYDQIMLQKGVVICEECRWGYINEEGVNVVKPQFEFAADFKQEVGMVYQHQKWGLIDKTGRQILPCKYDNLRFLEHTDNQIIQLYVENPRYGLIDTMGKLTVNAVYDEIGPVCRNRLAVRKGALWGFADREGREVIPCRYPEVGPFQEGLAAVRINRKWGFIDEEGRLVIAPKYKAVGNFSEGVAWVNTGSGTGFIDQQGALVIPATFELALDFSNGVSVVKKGDQYGLINHQGGYIVKPRYPWIGTFDDYGLAQVRLGVNVDRFGLINQRGELVTRQHYQQIEPFSEGLAAVKRRQYFGFIDTTGRVVIPIEYAKVETFSEGRAAVYKNGKCGYLSRTGEQIVDFSFTRCQDYQDGRAVVYQGLRRAGLIDWEGGQVLEPSVNRLLHFSQGRGLVRDQRYRFYYINEGANLYQGYYDKAGEFQHGLAVVKIGSKWGIINRIGQELIRPKYSKIESFDKGYAKVKIDGFSGLSTLDGELIVQPSFEFIRYAGEGLFLVEQGDKIGYFNRDGEWVWGLTN